VPEGEPKRCRVNLRLLMLNTYLTFIVYHSPSKWALLGPGWVDSLIQNLSQYLNEIWSSKS